MATGSGTDRSGAGSTGAGAGSTGTDRSGAGAWRAVVVTVSTSAAAGEAPDRSGPILVAGLRALGLVTDGPIVVADGPAVAEALQRALLTEPAVVLFTGGTGLTPDDVTPEQVAPLLDRQLPGLPEALRADGVASGVPTAMLSRGVAGIAKSSLVVTLPGSPGACRDALRVLGPIVAHAVGMIRGETGGTSPIAGHGTRL